MLVLMWILLVWGLVGMLFLFSIDRLEFRPLWPPTYRAWETALLTLGAFAFLFIFIFTGLFGIARHLGLRALLEDDSVPFTLTAALGLTSLLMWLNARRMETLQKLRGFQDDAARKAFVNEYLEGPSTLHLPQTETECSKKLESLKPIEKTLDDPYVPDVRLRREALTIAREELERQAERLREAEKRRKHHAELLRREEEEARQKAAQERERRRTDWFVVNGTKYVCGSCLMDVCNLDLGSPGVQKDPSVVLTRTGGARIVKTEFACDECGKTETHTILLD